MVVLYSGTETVAAGILTHYNYMMPEENQKIAQELLSSAGIEIDGNNPWDIRVHDKRTFGRIFREGSLGLGESYMDGWWDVPRLDQFVHRALRSGLDRQVARNLPSAVRAIMARVFNLQSRGRAFMVGEQHYDTGNELFEAMLGKYMAYSCGYWREAKDLDEAQEAKLDLICRKMGLAPGMLILDIGCGWGTFMQYAVKKYGVKAVGITVSKEQADYARVACAGLPVEVRLQDYRDVNGQFDRIISIGMFEHVGYKNYRTYMEVVHRCLKDDGLFLLHTIGGATSVTMTDPWLGKYIFPNGMLPSITQISTAAEKLFVVEDWHNFGADYDKTLMAWHENFVKHWPKLQGRYDERFYRMWTYYLLSCAGSFRARRNQLWQVVFSKRGVDGGWRFVR